MQSYSATITCSIVASLVRNGLLTSKVYKLYNKIHIILCETYPFFSRSTFHWLWQFPQVMAISLYLMKHAPLGFNALLAPPVCILGAELWNPP